MYIVYLFRYGPMPHAGSSNLLVSILLTAAAWGAHASMLGQSMRGIMDKVMTTLEFLSVANLATA